MTTLLITIAATVIAYRGVLYYLGKSKSEAAKTVVKILGGGGPGEE